MIKDEEELSIAPNHNTGVTPVKRGRVGGVDRKSHTAVEICEHLAQASGSLGTRVPISESQIGQGLSI